MDAILPTGKITCKARSGHNQRRIQKTRLPGKEGSKVTGGKNTLLLKEPIFPFWADEQIMKFCVFILFLCSGVFVFVKYYFANMIK
jgi:hypothetical protein